MAIEVTLKRVKNANGDSDILFPTTSLSQIYQNYVSEGSGQNVLLGDYLDDTFVRISILGAASGVATLDGNGKIKTSQLPASVFGGLRYVSSIVEDTNTDELANEIASYTSINGGISEGCYFIASDTILIEGTPNNVLNGGEEEVFSFPVTLESGDWLIYSKHETSGVVLWSVVNNTYQDATASNKGIIKLSDATSTTGMSGSDVITESILAGLMGTSAGKIAAGDHLHDSRYYTETEINNFFAGTTSIMGYKPSVWNDAATTLSTNATKWTSAYNWTSNADSNIASKVLDVAGEGLIVYGVDPFSNVVGAILIDTD